MTFTSVSIGIRDYESPRRVHSRRLSYDLTTVLLLLCFYGFFPATAIAQRTKIFFLEYFLLQWVT